MFFKPIEDTTPPTWWILLKIPQRKGFLAKSTTRRSEPAWCHPHSAAQIFFGIFSNSLAPAQKKTDLTNYEPVRTN
jgi:hypothetical protein